MPGGTMRDIVEIPQDQQVREGQKYRKLLDNVVQFSEGISCVYIILRLLSILLAPEKTWPIWTMFLLEIFFIRK